jgi:hypothetical protein
VIKKFYEFTATDQTGKIFYRTVTTNTSCTRTFFGDPSPNHHKQCLMTSVPTDISYDSAGVPKGEFKLCSIENGVCKSPDDKPIDILYGANGKYFYANAVSTPCDNASFGDPIPWVKSCYWRPSTKLPSAPAPAPATPTTCKSDDECGR